MTIENIKKQIVFSDYDGTIYITEEDMTRNVNAIKEYRSLGGKFVIITGRSTVSINKVIKKYDISYDYIISNNGAVIFNSDMVKIYEQPISKEVSSKILEYLKLKENKQNIEISLYDENDKVQDYEKELLKIRVKTSDYKLAQNIENDINNIFKNDVKAHSAFPSMYYDDQNFVVVDIVSKNAGKEKAIKRLLEILEIEKEQVVTIGDGRNDIDMIKEYKGYSMETAEEEVKKSASKIFKTVADILEELQERK